MYKEESFILNNNDVINNLGQFFESLISHDSEGNYCLPIKSIRDIVSKDNPNNNEDLEEILLKSRIMTSFLNNRIGDELRQSEIGKDDENIRSTRNFKKGSIVILKDDNNMYKFVLFIDYHKDNKDKAKIVIKRSNFEQQSHTTDVVNISSLYQFIQNDVKQNDHKFNEQRTEKRNGRRLHHRHSLCEIKPFWRKPHRSFV